MVIGVCGSIAAVPDEISGVCFLIVMSVSVDFPVNYVPDDSVVNDDESDEGEYRQGEDAYEGVIGCV